MAVIEAGLNTTGIQDAGSYRRSWVVTVDEYDPKRHFDKVRGGFSGISVANHTVGHVGVHAWNGSSSEQDRLNLQNRGKKSWGSAHAAMHDGLRHIGFLPKTIVQIGTGSDATLGMNLLNLFPGVDRLTLVELDKDKLDGAMNTLREGGYPMGKVTDRHGEATQVLPGIAGADEVDAQCLFQHLVKAGPDGRNIPLTWNEKAQGPYPTLERVIDSVTNVLRLGGLAVVADLAICGWNNRAAPGYETDPEVRDMIEFAENYRRNAIMFGWTARGASAFRGASDIADTIVGASQGRLVLSPKLSMKMEFDGVGPEHRFTGVTASIPLVLYDAVSKARKGYEAVYKEAIGARREALEARIPRLQAAERFLGTAGPKYVDLLQDPRIITDLPPYYAQAFQRVG